MPSVSTHVLDAAAGGAREGVTVEVRDAGGAVVGTGLTDRDGRSGTVASGLAPGSYRLTWRVGRGLIEEVAVVVALTAERHYHIPLLSSPASAVAYLGV